MIWLVLAVLPLVVGYGWCMWKAWQATLLTTGIVILGLCWVFLLVYGLYDIGAIMQCGGDTFWTAL